MRLLVADDDRDAADTLAALLRQAGYEVHVAYGGPDAIKLAEAFCPDALILDLAMPILDGIQVAHRLRAIPQFRDKCFVALTGHCEQIHLDAASKADFDEYLIKPCKFEVLLSILAEPERHQQPSKSKSMNGE